MDNIVPWNTPQVQQAKCNSKPYNKAYVTPEATRKYWLRRKFGITVKQYDDMLAKQCGVCASCGKPETQIDRQTKKIRPLAVDHDHKTGDIRALLCAACNMALGLMNEDFERIHALADYAEWCRNRETSAKIIQLRLIE